MQTFLPYKDFEKSAKSLDNKRLNKQILEGYQILCVLANKKVVGDDGYSLEEFEHSWKNHPAVKMWKGHHTALLEYVHTMNREWVHRGFNSNIALEKAKYLYLNYFFNEPEHSEYNYPTWLGDTDFHVSHRANLKRKAYEDIDRYAEKKQVKRLDEAITWAATYEVIWPGIPADMPYVWPV